MLRLGTGVTKCRRMTLHEGMDRLEMCSGENEGLASGLSDAGASGHGDFAPDARDVAIFAVGNKIGPLAPGNDRGTKIMDSRPGVI